jgi:hypothetical protein
MAVKTSVQLAKIAQGSAEGLTQPDEAFFGQAQLFGVPGHGHFRRVSAHNRQFLPMVGNSWSANPTTFWARIA